MYNFDVRTCHLEWIFLESYLPLVTCQDAAYATSILKYLTKESQVLTDMPWHMAQQSHKWNILL